MTLIWLTKALFRMSDIGCQNCYLLNDMKYLRNIMFITQNTEFEKANCTLVSFKNIFAETRTRPDRR